MSEKLDNYFKKHKIQFFIFNTIFILLLLRGFVELIYPQADFAKALTPNNLSFIFFGMEGEIGGLMLTFYLAFIIIIASFVIGSLLGIARYSNNKFISVPATIYIELFRALPLIMIIFWVFFAFPIIANSIFDMKMENSAITSAIISFVLFESAYIAEIIRAGLKSIPQGQFEASQTLGMNKFQTFIFIILPQAYRRMIPSLLSQFVSLFKDTSLIYVIGVIEFFRAATIVNNRIYMSFEIISFVAIVYFLCAFTLSQIAVRIEKKVEKQLHS